MPATPSDPGQTPVRSGRAARFAALTAAALLLWPAGLNLPQARAETGKGKTPGPTVAEKPLGKPRIVKSFPRYTRPAFYGRPFPRQEYKGFILIGNVDLSPGAASNEVFYSIIKRTLDMIERKTPFLFSLLQSINKEGKRIFFYTGRIGPASFNAWNNAYIVRITATHLDDRPVFDNNPYYLAATLVHEMIGHGRQAEDGRLWPMYDWCGKDIMDVRGVMWTPNRLGRSSGLVEYEANLYAQWFLETAQDAYPKYIAHFIKRYLRVVKFLNRRFPLWYDDQESSWILLQEFATHFRDLCPGLKFTPHPLPRG